MRSYPRRLRLPLFVFVLALLAAFLYGLPIGPAGAQAHGDEHGAADHAKPNDGHGAGAHAAPKKKKEMMGRLIEHVLDGEEFHIFNTLWPQHLDLKMFGTPIFGKPFTKFMILELIAAALIIVIYVPLARQVRNGAPARGWFWNAFEVLLTFVREQIAKPSIGAEHADRYVPFLWTLFLFVLFNNLLGMFPFLGSATASIFVTGALALVVFFAIHGSAVIEMANAPAHGHGHDEHGHHAHAAEGSSLARGLWRYVTSLWPQIDLPLLPMGLPIKLLVFGLEVMGVLVRNGVLAIRLFANMFAGHMVLATILLFIEMAANLVPGAMGGVLWGTVTVSSVVGIVALSLLELFVAFLQAYIFTFLTALFMGMAMHPQH